MTSLCFTADDAAATPAFSLPSKMPIHFHLRATEFDLPPTSPLLRDVPSRPIQSSHTIHSQRRYSIFSSSWPWAGTWSDLVCSFASDLRSLSFQQNANSSRTCPGGLPCWLTEGSWSVRSFIFQLKKNKGSWEKRCNWDKTRMLSPCLLGLGVWLWNVHFYLTAWYVSFSHQLIRIM